MQRRLTQQIACGRYHTVILAEDNDVFVFGKNSYGQLGLCHNKNQTNSINER